MAPPPTAPRRLADALFLLLRACLLLAALTPAVQAAAPEPWVLADVDGDLSPDLIQGRPTLEQGEWRIAALDVESAPASLPLRARFLEALRLVPRDLDNDADLDLIVYQDFGARRVGVWINDGHGVFQPASPATLGPTPLADHDVTADARTPPRPGGWHNSRRTEASVAADRYSVSLPSHHRAYRSFKEPFALRLPYEAASGLSPPL